MKKLTIALLATAAVAAPAQIKQTWTNSIIDANQSSITLRTAVSPSGSTFTLAAMADKTGRLICYDGVGAVKWTLPLTTITSNDGAKLTVDSAGNPIVMYPGTANDCWLAKIDANDGSNIWKRQIQGVLRTVEIGLDGQDNIVTLSHGALETGGYGPVVRKFTTNGNALFTYSSELPSYENTSMAVAANGQIYFAGCKLDVTGAKENLVALTPNGTLRYSTAWTNPGGSFSRPQVAADRNGRVSVVDIKNDAPSILNIRYFDSAGAMSITEDSIGANYRVVKAKYDADGLLVIAAQVDGNTGSYISIGYFDTTDPYAEQISAATVPSGQGLASSLSDLFTDAFGQAYVCAPQMVGSTGSIARVIAFDQYHHEPIWSFTQSFDPTKFYNFSGAVGRWGHVGLAGTIGSNSSYEAASGIRQSGLRNLLINGQSFTGGRTITGTVNFYSNDGVDRTVALTSNSPTFASVSPTATVTAGNSQVGMSIELKPTSIRRAIRIEGTFNGSRRRAVFYIEPPVVSGLTLYPTTVQGGKIVNATARINGAAPTGGIAVSLASNEVAAPVPASVSVAEGTLTKGFTIPTATVVSTKTATITATTGTASKTATLTITP